MACQRNRAGPYRWETRLAPARREGSWLGWFRRVNTSGRALHGPESSMRISRPHQQRMKAAATWAGVVVWVAPQKPIAEPSSASPKPTTSDHSLPSGEAGIAAGGAAG